MSAEKKDAPRDTERGGWLTKQIEQAKDRATRVDEKRREVIDLKYKRQIG